jgi:hypothetical protein
MQAYRYEVCTNPRCKQAYPNVCLDPHTATCYCLHCGAVLDDQVLLAGPSQYLARDDVFRLFPPDGHRPPSAGYQVAPLMVAT